MLPYNTVSKTNEQHEIFACTIVSPYFKCSEEMLDEPSARSFSKQFQSGEKK